MLYLVENYSKCLSCIYIIPTYVIDKDSQRRNSIIQYKLLYSYIIYSYSVCVGIRDNNKTVFSAFELLRRRLIKTVNEKQKKP